MTDASDAIIRLERLMKLLVEGQREYLTKAFDGHDAEVKTYGHTRHISAIDPLKVASDVQRYQDAMKVVDVAISREREPAASSTPEIGVSSV